MSDQFDDQESKQDTTPQAQKPPEEIHINPDNMDHLEKGADLKQIRKSPDASKFKK